MIVGSAACRAEHANLLRQQGFTCQEADDPYQAMLELSRPAAVYRALVVSLAGLYREELPLIGAVKRWLPGVEIWLTNTEGRVAAMAEAMRLGADGLLAADEFPSGAGEPVLSAEELRALLQDQPVFPPEEQNR